jgi:hypothetical protein
MVRLAQIMHLVVPSGVSKTISEPMLHLAQTMHLVTEPLELYGPHMPTIAFQASNIAHANQTTLVVYRVSSGEPRIIHVLQLIKDQQRSCYNTTT